MVAATNRRLGPDDAGQRPNNNGRGVFHHAPESEGTPRVVAAEVDAEIPVVSFSPNGYGQPLASPPTSRCKHFASVLRRHASPKSVGSFSAGVVGLIRPLHCSFSASFRAPRNERTSVAAAFAAVKYHSIDRKLDPVGHFARFPSRIWADVTILARTSRSVDTHDHGTAANPHVKPTSERGPSQARLCWWHDSLQSRQIPRRE